MTTDTKNAKPADAASATNNTSSRLPDLVETCNTCLRKLLEAYLMDYGHFEIIVKDGGSGTIQARLVQRDAQSLNPIGVVIESDDVELG